MFGLQRRDLSRIDSENAARLALEDSKRAADTREQELRTLQLDGIELEERRSRTASEVEELRNSLERTKSEIGSYQTQINQRQFEKDRLNNDIRRLRAIIDKPAPVELWGNYCKNGHLNCPNLPTVVRALGNAAEIEAHRQSVVKAYEEIRNQSARLNELENVLETLEQRKLGAERVLQNAEVRVNDIVNALSQLEDQLERNRVLQNIKTDEYRRAQLEVNQRENLLAEARRATTDSQFERPSARLLSPDELQAIARAEIEREEEEKRMLVSRVALLELAREGITDAGVLLREVGVELREEVTEAGEIVSRAIAPVAASASQLLTEARSVVTETRSTAAGLLEAAGSFYPAHVFAMQAMGRRMDEIAELPDIRTENPLIDREYRR